MDSLHGATARRGVTGGDSAGCLNVAFQGDLEPGRDPIKIGVGGEPQHISHRHRLHPQDTLAMEPKAKCPAVADATHQVAALPSPKLANTEAPSATTSCIKALGAPAKDGTGATTMASGAGPSRQRKDKGIMVADRTEEEKTPLVVNMARARGLNCARFLAVGIFLSFLAIPSKQLISYMKRVWKIRGIVDCNQIADQRFIVEFSEEGDFEHVTNGGPWRYVDDAVLIRALKEGENPATVPFDTVPIWAQFAGVPFYLLSKELARDLGKKLGTLVSIDNNSRGDICNKILRARVLLPLRRALQRQIILEDEITDEEVVVSVFYERLPNFCLYCGVIGHRELNCLLPVDLRKKRYCPSLGVKATSASDIRRYHMPSTAGQSRRPLHMALPWRVVMPTVSRMEAKLTAHQLTVVSNVAQGVARLMVQEGAPAGGGSDKGEEKNASSAASSIAIKVPEQAPATIDFDITSGSNNNTPKIVITNEAYKADISIGNEAEGDKDKAEEARSSPSKAAPKETAKVDAEPMLNINQATQEKGELDKEPEGPTAKETSHSPVPSLSEGARAGDNALIRRLREEARRGEEGPRQAARTSILGKRADRGKAEMEEDDESYSFDVIVSNKKFRGAVLSEHEEAIGKDGGQEATSPRAAGKLTGAADRACQEP
ncbi:hypothetical protein QYE76_027787 [Lolium multiflorum]|uniref:DUF4283 domain-containing protein n=1 Tax=Lolium multiflorum TaxID=4521 RepID=A0AAD8VF86_LOLMU|nr:hypothetical protein QYE76_027787 [Lolium multiflorum]